MEYTIVSRDDDKSREIAKCIESKLKIAKNQTNPEIVIAIGGDGTILKAVHLYKNSIIFGIHTGHLGFYANYDCDDVLVLIDDINNNKFKIDELDILEAEFSDKNGKKINDFAMNEITLVCPPRTIRLDVSIDNEYFERFRGTGLAVSTPYGSTAYNKSLDGSVVDTSLSVMQLTEIAGINSNAYRTLQSPLILSSERSIKLEAKEKQADIFITADHITYNINDFDYVKISYKKNAIKMAYHDHCSFLTRISRTFIISKD